MTFITQSQPFQVGVSDFVKYINKLLAIMKNYNLKYILVSLLILLTVKVNAQEILKSKYYFINGGKVFSMQKSNDTLYTFKCNSNFDCAEKASDHYKILKSKQDGNRYLFEVEKLDSLQLTTNPIPDDRFRLIGFEKISENEIKIINEARSFTKDSIVKIPFEVKYLDNKFGFTYYTENYLKSFRTDYTITPEFAKEIIESCKSNTEIITQYNNTNTGDWYASGISAELLTLEMIKLNLSPINAKQKMSKALKD